MMLRQLGLFDAIEIPLTKGYTTVIDAVDADLTEFKWHAIKSRHESAYAAREFCGRRVVLHRLILERKIGRALTKGELADHKDNDPLNNRRDNLRVATYSQNSANSAARRTSKGGLKGASFNKLRGTWTCQLMVNGKRVYMGVFATAEESHAAYCKAAARLHGEFARFE